MAFQFTSAARTGGVFRFERGGDVLEITYRAIYPTVDLAIAADRAYRTSRTIRSALDEGRALGFALPPGLGEGWRGEDWERFGATLVQAELLALVATAWTGATMEDGSPAPLRADYIRTLMIADSEFFNAWSRAAAEAVAEVAEGNVYALSPTGFTAGADDIAQNVLN